MAVIVSLSLCWIWLFVSVLRPAASEDKKIRQKIGQNVTLPCQAPNNSNIIVVEWSRGDLGTEYVFFYRDGHFEPANQHPSFKDRVDLQDKQMKDGNVSVILKNVTINDNGTYECRVQVLNARRKRANLDSAPISIITLTVDPSGPGGGDSGDGGKKDGGKKDGGNKGEADQDSVKRNHYSLVALMTVTGVMTLIIGVLYFKKYTHKKSHLNSSSDENQRKHCFQKQSLAVVL